jgi:hypothetical protein
VTEPIFTRTIKPRDCTILLGVPTDLAGFRHDLDAENKDLVRNRCPVWPRYRQEVVVPADRLIAIGREYGATLRRDAALSDIGPACRGDSSVVIFVGHWTTQCVEFFDGLHPFRDIVDEVPTEFEGFLDLLVCAPDALAIALRDLRPRAIIRFAMKTAVIPAIWFGFFEVLFASLAEHRCPYMAAFSEITELFLRGETRT